MVDNASGPDEAAAIERAAADGEARFEALALPDNAGYAGGILSAAVDGIKIAEAVAGSLVGASAGLSSVA